MIIEPKIETITFFTNFLTRSVIERRSSLTSFQLINPVQNHDHVCPDEHKRAEIVGYRKCIISTLSLMELDALEATYLVLVTTTLQTRIRISERGH